MPDPSRTLAPRGRPPKFGRPARLVAVTLPNDVVSWLETLHPDIGRAIVTLHDEAAPRRRAPGTARPAPGRDCRCRRGAGPDRCRPGSGPRAVRRGRHPVRPGAGLPGPRALVDDGRPGAVVVDCLQGDCKEPAKRRALEAFREQLRSWRYDRRQHWIRGQSSSQGVSPSGGGPGYRPTEIALGLFQRFGVCAGVPPLAR